MWHCHQNNLYCLREYLKSENKGISSDKRKTQLSLARTVIQELKDVKNEGLLKDQFRKGNNDNQPSSQSAFKCK